jgi:tetratricopeptide (TPR) repeat protein
MNGVRLRAVAVVAAASLALLVAGGVWGLRTGGRAAEPEPARPVAVSAVDRLTASINRAQERLADVPGDHPTWAALGMAYLERARITADPSYYPKAEGALRRSLQLRPQDNADAMAGLGALANARHEFAEARDWARKALAINPYDADSYAVLADAYTQLGQAAAATAAVQRMLDLRPGLPAYARASYDLEQRGLLTEARELLDRALATAVDASDVAFCRYHLGELAWHAGDLDTAEREYAAGFAADPAYLPLREGQARVAAARGRMDAAIAGYADLTARSPTPANLLAYANLLRVSGRTTEATAQLALAGAAHKLFVTNGGTDNLAGAELAIAQGRPDTALRLAQQEWRRRQHADVADLMAWTLHLAGRDAQARTYAQRAAALGARNATYAYHLGVIERALGHRDAARRHLARAMAINPYFSPVDAPLAAKALAELGES